MFRHTDEGPDDMPGHVKSTIIGASLNIPITKGQFAFGTWQGVYLCEHRNTGGFGGKEAHDRCQPAPALHTLLPGVSPCLPTTIPHLLNTTVHVREYVLIAWLQPRASLAISPVRTHSCRLTFIIDILIF